MKKIVATTLSLSIVVSALSLTSYAWAPTDFENSKCIDVSDLNEKRYISRYGKICGCTDCGFDALTYEKFEDYLNDVERNSNELIKSQQYLENKIKQENIYSTLKHISAAIEEQRYIGKNFILVSKNNNPNEQDSFAQFAKADEITFDEKMCDTFYFNKINEEKIKPLLTKVENNLKFYDTKKLKNKHGWTYYIENGILYSLIAASTTMIISAVGSVVYQSINYLKQKNIHNKKAGELFQMIKQLPNTRQEFYKKKLTKYLNNGDELTKKNLKKLPDEVVDTFLTEIKSEKVISND